MLKAFAVIALATVLCFWLFSPTQVYALEILVALTDNYDMVFTPSFYISEIPALTLYTGSRSISTIRTYSMFGVNSVFFNINLTATNVNGTVFLNASFWLDTLAEQKIRLYKSYDPQSYTKNITLTVDAYLFVDFANQTDISKTFHGQWGLTLP